MKSKLSLVLGLVLLVSIVLNGWLMKKFHWPQRFFKSDTRVKVNVPTIELSRKYNSGGTPQLAFADSIKAGAEFRAWQDKARTKLIELLGVSLTSEAPAVRVLAHEMVGEISRETLVFTAKDGVEVPAFLLVPKSNMPRPALIVIPGHSLGIAATAGIAEDYQHSMALRLAEAGYVTLTMEVRGFGYLQKIGEPGRDMDSGAALGMDLVHGRSLPGLTVSDTLMGMNYLEARKEVEPRQMGVVGFSSGGKAAIYLAAVDQRVKALVASGCVESLEANFRYSQHGADEAVPYLANWLEMSDCLALVAPRAALAQWGEKDNDRESRCAAWNESSLPTWEAARKAYAAAQNAENLEKYVTPGLGHEFDVRAAAEFLKKRLPVK